MSRIRSFSNTKSRAFSILHRIRTSWGLNMLLSNKYLRHFTLG
jgi:hypothetical protein